jgi:hypothetical protein
MQAFLKYHLSNFKRISVPLRQVMLPIPGFVVAFINGMLAFVDETTRAKFGMVRDASGLAKACGVPSEVLPSTLRAY